MTILRQHAEHQFAHELTALAAADERPRPPSWRLSPFAVATYLLGGARPDGTEITAKYIGSRRLIEIAIATLATDRALRVHRIPEGTVVFPHEPLVQVQGPIIQSQILETILLNLINFQTLIATKAARICLATRGEPVLEFGLRRAHGDLP